MAEKAILLTPGFSTADAQYPSFALRGGSLVLEFEDWRERQIVVTFTNAAGVMWQEVHSPGPQDRDDSVYEIDGSSWMAQYLASAARTPGDALRHYRLCFNASGVLDVLAAAMVPSDAG
jgi:hypothetical protein